jgi:hypothetical protein
MNRNSFCHFAASDHLPKSCVSLTGTRITFLKTPTKIYDANYLSAICEDCILRRKETLLDADCGTRPNRNQKCFDLGPGYEVIFGCHIAQLSYIPPIYPGMSDSIFKILSGWRSKLFPKCYLLLHSFGTQTAGNNGRGCGDPDSTLIKRK